MVNRRFSNSIRRGNDAGISVGLRKAAAVVSATVGGCREVNSPVVVVDVAVVVSAVVSTSAELAIALSSGSACPLGYLWVATPTRGEFARPRNTMPTHGGMASLWWKLGVGGHGPSHLGRH